MSKLRELVSATVDGHQNSAEDVQSAFAEMLSGEASPTLMASFLTALRTRGESVDEIVGAVRAMRAAMARVSSPAGSVDVVGTGGDGAHTYNISTAVSFVVAGAGVPVAKHGNRAASSKSGAADVLAELGVNLDADAETVQRAIVDANVGFMMATKYHSAMRHVGPVRKELGIRTLFNILGPLSNPSGATRQLIGVFSPLYLERMAEALGELGTDRAWLVHGSGLDEMSLHGPTDVVELDRGSIRRFSVSASDLGLAEAPLEAIRGGEPAVNAAALRQVLASEPSAYRDMVLLNAAGALVVAEKAADLHEGVALARSSIETGAAQSALDALVRITNG